MSFCIRKLGVLNCEVLPCTSIEYFALADKYKVRLKDGTDLIIPASEIFETKEAAFEHVMDLYDKQIADNVRKSATIEVPDV